MARVEPLRDIPEQEGRAGEKNLDVARILVVAVERHPRQAVQRIDTMRPNQPFAGRDRGLEAELARNCEVARARRRLVPERITEMLDRPAEFTFEPERAFAHASRTGPTILLNHNPDAKDILRRYPWHLMLAGHTHGNQIYLPFLGRHPWAVVQDPRFIAGRYDWEGRQLHINRGIGGLAGIRLNCRPEVSLLLLEPAPQPMQS